MRAQQGQVAVLIGLDAVAHIPEAAAVERQGQLVFGMMVPFERDAVGQTAVEQGPGTARVTADFFQKWFHVALQTPE
jgi:hypothetical protein